MQRLVPSVASEDVADAYAGLVLDRPAAGDRRARVALGMVASVDGTVTIDGTSGQLGGAADRVAFRRLRGACDAILVGAGTARAEDYGPPRVPADRVAARISAGLAPAPQLLVVTASGDLDPDARLFTATRDESVPPPIVVTCGAVPADRLEALRAVAEVVTFGDEEVDLVAMLRWCRDRELGRVLCEGGPALNGALLAADLVDEVFLTVAPVLVAGAGGRIVDGPALTAPVDLELVELREHGGELLLRYRTVPSRSTGRE
ncbi:MAG: dihydrofolate reductase family protein [Nitriliruptor sp.]|uniref:dihydrofolate reductase family protein n=1 Tax=Nitriliruptor sp. TaxID=2448056 RepID=UPI0034A02DC5